MEDPLRSPPYPAAPGTVALEFRCDPAKDGDAFKGLQAFLPKINLAGARVEGIDAQGSDFRVSFVTAPGTVLPQLAGECSIAVEDAFLEQGIRTGWTLCVVDDQGRVYRPK